ncbi:MAG: hypothetical protein ACT4OT_11730 [Acidobacteriota bacterium]
MKETKNGVIYEVDPHVGVIYEVDPHVKAYWYLPHRLGWVCELGFGVTIETTLASFDFVG